MPYIIDCNNVMGQTPGWHRDKSGARRKLLQKLAQFARLRKIRITAVFDGGADSEFPEGSAHQGVRILYARPGSNADFRIVKLVESATDRGGITVVTSDRQLAFLVKSAGGRVLRSGEFRQRMNETIGKATDSGDETVVEDMETEAWLRYFGRLPNDEDDS